MKYDLFLFDLDDTLLDFRASEKLAFYSTLQALGVKTGLDEIFEQYKIENQKLWKLFEQGKTTKDHLKIERFRKVLESRKLELDPALVSETYNEELPKNVVLIDHAEELCEWLSHRGEIGIITNGIHTVATQRIKNSKLAPYISFVCVSETCGYAKPDTRFFEHSAKMAKKFSKASSLVVGDRLETDIQGASNFDLDSCWFNPQGLPRTHLSPKYEVKHLSEIRILGI